MQTIRKCWSCLEYPVQPERIRIFARARWNGAKGRERGRMSFSPTCPLSRFRSSVNTRGNSNSRQTLRRVLSPPAFALLSLFPFLPRLVKLSWVVYDCLVCLSLSIHDCVQFGRKDALSERACFSDVNQKSERALSLWISTIAATVKHGYFVLKEVTLYEKKLL